jgi:hypothetical protein
MILSKLNLKCEQKELQEQLIRMIDNLVAKYVYDEKQYYLLQRDKIKKMKVGEYVSFGNLRTILR